jgi:hypothetical protein
MKKVFKDSQKVKGPLESQERDGWTMLKMIWGKWVLVAREKRLGLETPENWSWSRPGFCTLRTARGEGDSVHIRAMRFLHGTGWTYQVAISCA